MKIKITGAPPYDGEYDVDFARLTNGQIRTIKRLSGYTPAEYVQAGTRGDNDFLVAVTVAALERDPRHGIINEAAFWDAEAGGIEIIPDEDEAAELPPQSAPETPTTPSGAPSNDAGDSPQERNLRITGTDS
jgi:hypothetical protein